jgi:hypothetical protein
VNKIANERISTRLAQLVQQIAKIKRVNGFFLKNQNRKMLIKTYNIRIANTLAFRTFDLDNQIVTIVEEDG